MKVTLTSIMAGPDGSHQPGETIDVDKKTAIDLKKGGHAIDAPTSAVDRKIRTRDANQSAPETTVTDGGSETAA